MVKVKNIILKGKVFMSKKLKFPFDLNGKTIATVKEIKELFIQREEWISQRINTCNTEFQSSGVGGYGLNMILEEDDV